MYNVTYIDNMNYSPAPSESTESTVGVFPATEVPVVHGSPTKHQQQKHYHFIVSIVTKILSTVL